jgi:hypothetical protein
MIVAVQKYSNTELVYSNPISIVRISGFTLTLNPSPALGEGL